jgi:pyruvate dehydrogenase E2 component (dihydrolipoamide acetyltransferase)
MPTPIPITIPRLGWNMEEGTFMGWLKRDGDRVVAGEPLFILEGDKATQDVESLETGILSIPPDAPKEGEKVQVGARIGYLLAPEERALPLWTGEPHSLNRVAGFREGEPPGEPQLPSGSAGASPSRPAPCPAEIVQGHREAPPALRAVKPRISPRARRAARELGVDAAGLRGTGATGRVRERDVRAAAQAMRSGAAAISRERAAGIPTGGESSHERRIPVNSVRRTIAERMVRSVQSTASVTLTTTADATNLVNLRRQFKTVAGQSDTQAVSLTDIIVKLTALALEQHPLLNARWDGDAIVVAAGIHIGIAVDTEAGLLVPVIRDVPRHGLRELAATSRNLIDRARQGTLSASELGGSTFTVSNLGPLGIETFTPLINPPECAVLGVGRISRQVVPDEHQFVARDRIFLSLTFDHRVVDGAPAARFLQSLGLLIENPSPWLLA